MKRALKWAGFGVGGLVVLAAVAAVCVYLLSERALRRQYAEVPLTAIVVPTDATSIAAGKRLATIYGCFNSCHGDRMEGRKLLDDPAIARINAPNLTRVVREYTDAQLERLIRHGVKRDGTSTWVMPSPMFARMSDEDLGQVIAFVRSAPVVDEPKGDKAVPDVTMQYVTMRPLGRLGIVLGKFKPLATKIEPGLRHDVKTDRSNTLAFGEYLVMTTCTECHGQDLKGDDFLKAPNLVVTAGYSDAAFRKLMTTGIALGDRKLGLMTEVGETRFPSLTEQELVAIREYLTQTFGNVAPEPTLLDQVTADAQRENNSAPSAEHSAAANVPAAVSMPSAANVSSRRVSGG